MNRQRAASGPGRLHGGYFLLAAVAIGAYPVGAGAKSEPAVPVRDVVFIVDGSSSVEYGEFLEVLEVIRRFVCGDLAPDPVQEPFGAALIQFADGHRTEITYRVIDTAAKADNFCQRLDAIVKLDGNTFPLAAFAAAESILSTNTMAPQRTVMMFTDGGFNDDNFAVRDQAEAIRTLEPPVRICVTVLSTGSCRVLREVANWPFETAGIYCSYSAYKPDQPAGLIGATSNEPLADLVCQDCLCAPDCNGNAVADPIDVVSGAAQNCDGDEIPEECTDCNANGIGDWCEIAAGTAFDCNRNFVLDVCDISAGAPDCDGNGVPDVCEDCNRNGIADACELAAGTAPDCNENGVIDMCDIAGASADCDGNLVPDECEDCDGNGVGDFCEMTGPFSAASGPLPITGDRPLASCLIAAPPPAEGDLTFSFTAAANLGQQSEYLRLLINGQFIARFFEVGGAHCTPVSTTVTVSDSIFNGLVGDGDALIEIDGNNVFPPLCGNPFIDITVAYQTRQGVDGNLNDRLDVCERALGDFNLDEQVNVTDLLALLGSWGACGGGSCHTDVNGDGVVSVSDLLILLANWGPT